MHVHTEYIGSLYSQEPTKTSSSSFTTTTWFSGISLVSDGNSRPTKYRWQLGHLEQEKGSWAGPKLPSDHYTTILNILLEFLQIPEEWSIPPLWHQWANSTKCQDFQILSEALHAYTHSPEAFNNSAPVVNAKLDQELQSFLFMDDSKDDLKSVCSLLSSLMCQQNIIKPIWRYLVYMVCKILESTHSCYPI